MASQNSTMADDESASLLELVAERFRNVAERFRDDVFSLISESQAYLKESDLPRFGDATEEDLLASREAYRLSLRLKELMARAISFHAWSNGKVTIQDALSPQNRLRPREENPESAAPAGQGPKSEICALSERSIVLYERACRLEDMLADFYDMPGPSESTGGEDEVV